MTNVHQESQEQEKGTETLVFACDDRSALQRAWEELGLAPETICNWVPTRALLARVSGNDAERLTEDILASWCTSALRVIIVREINTKLPLGFATLTREESSGMPEDCAELCHLIVDPQHGSAWTVQHIVKAALHVSHSLGIHQCVARVTTDNNRMLRFARLMRYTPIDPLPSWADPQFQWFSNPSHSDDSLNIQNIAAKQHTIRSFFQEILHRFRQATCRLRWGLLNG